jgi:RNA polymerase-binding transcription factor DksA
LLKSCQGKDKNVSKSSQKFKKLKKKIGQKFKTRNRKLRKFARKARRKTENTDYDECSASVDQIRLRRIW